MYLASGAPRTHRHGDVVEARDLRVGVDGHEHVRHVCVDAVGLEPPFGHRSIRTKRSGGSRMTSSVGLDRSRGGKVSVEDVKPCRYYLGLSQEWLVVATGGGGREPQRTSRYTTHFCSDADECGTGSVPSCRPRKEPNKHAFYFIYHVNANKRTHPSAGTRHGAPLAFEAGVGSLRLSHSSLSPAWRVRSDLSIQ